MYLPLIRQELNQSQNVLQDFIRNEQKLEAVQNAALLISSAFRLGGKVISCGNGGSHCDAMHFAEELSGRYREDRPALPGLAISDASHLSCVSNDYGYESAFSRYLEALGNPGDVLIGFSGSGNSMNVVRAMETARAKGMKTVALTGNGGGKMASLADIEIRVDHYGYADRIQEIHIKVVHILILLIEEEMKK